MADVRVRFIGDAASLRSFYAQLGRETRAFGNAVTRDSEKLAKQFFNIGKDTPVQLGRVQTSVDSINKTFRTMAQSTVTWTEKVQRFSNAQQALWKAWKASGLSTAGFGAMVNPIDPNAATDMEKLLNFMNAKGPFSNVTNVNRVLLDQKEIIRGNYEAWTKANEQIAQQKVAAQTALPAIRNLVQQARLLGPATTSMNVQNPGSIQNNMAMLSGLISRYGGIQRVNAYQYRDPLTGQFVSPQYMTNLQNAIKMYGERVKQLIQMRKNISDELKKIAEESSGGRGPQGIQAARMARDAARVALPPVPEEWQQLMAADKQGKLLKSMARAGFGKGMGVGDVIGQMYTSNLRVVDDITKGVTRVSGSFTDWRGRTKELSAELDRNGKIVQRWGGNFRGISSMLGQTVRDFQKVIEWTIATTVVFAGLRTAMQGFEIVKEFDLLLTRFSITAQLSSAETAKMFESMSDIAYNTATPLKELLTAMDDIAFGTKKAGQSTAEWERSILSLAEAVGIYTNLTGSSAEQSTELLVATMKQLGIEAEEVIGILNKITAVAGGQSKAISDITQGLSVMAEAGKQAQLSTDQQIAVIKTLSLVTSKSPAEVATAFKNLVGALDNPMALKALESYNIPVKDLEGNLRNIIDIYSEIQAKIQQGVIPASDVKMLIRQISGGPRRAPDAAALLANIGEVQSVTQQSIFATNQALMANATIMESINAQWTQLTNLIQSTFYEQASSEFESLAKSFMDLSKAMIPLIGGFAGIIAQAVKLGGLYLVLRAVVGTAKFLVGGFQGFLFSLTRMNPALLAITRATNNMNMSLWATTKVTPVLSGRLGALETRLLSLLRSYKNLGKAASFIGLGAFTGGVISGMATGDPLQGLGGALAAGGMAAMAVPSPYFITQIGGAVAFLAGSIMMMNSGTKDSTTTNKEHSKSIVTLIGQYKEAGRVFDLAQTSNSELAKQIDVLNKVENKNADQKSLLLDYQKQYVTNTQTMIESTIQLSDAQRELNRLTGGTVTKYLSSTGRVSKEVLDKIARDNIAAILERNMPTLPEFTYKPGFPTTGPTTTDIRNFGFSSSGPTFGAEAIGGQLPTKSTITIDFKNLTGEDLKKLFDLTTGKLRIQIPPGPNGENLINTENAITRLRDSLGVTDDIIGNMYDSIANLGASWDPFLSNANLAIQVLDAIKIKGDLTLISSGDAAAMAEIVVYMTQIMSLINIAKSQGQLDEGAFNTAQNEIQRLMLSLADLDRFPAGEVRNEALKNIAQSLLRLAGDYLPSFSEAMKIAGGEAAYANEQFSFIPDTLASVSNGISATVEALAGGEFGTLGGSLKELLDGFMADVSGQSAKTQADLQGGQFKKGRFDKDYIRAAGQIEGMVGATAAVEKLAEGFKNLEAELVKVGSSWDGAVEPALDTFAKSLTRIKGLENATSLSTTDLIGKMLDLGRTANLNKEQWTALLLKLQELPGIIALLAKAKVKIPIGLDFSGYKAQLEKMISWLKKIPFSSVLLKTQIDALQGQLEAVNAAMSFGEEVSSIYGRGAGNVATPGAAAQANRAGYIQIPDEFRDQEKSVLELVKQAVANAKLVQSQIPGEAKRNKDEIVSIFDGLKKIFQTKGIGESYLNTELRNLADEIKRLNDNLTKADTIRRIRVGQGDFAAIANVPVNAKTGISVGGPQGPITVTLNIVGQVLTQAQIDQLGNSIAAGIGRAAGLT